MTLLRLIFHQKPRGIWFYIYIYIYIYIYEYDKNTFMGWFSTSECVCVCVYIYVYIYIYICVCVYFGSISLLIQISLNIIDIFCLHIFFWIRLYCFYHIHQELIYVLSIVVYILSTFCPTLGHHQGRIYYESDATFVFAYYHYVRASLPLKIMAFAFKWVSIISVSS